MSAATKINDNERLAYTYEEAAELVGVSHWTIRRMVDAGDLIRVKFGRSVRIPRQSLLDYMAREAAQQHTGEKPAPCRTSAKTRPTGGSRTPTRAAAELASLLERGTTKRPRR